MNRQELINENLDECAVIRECDKNGDVGTDASERIAAVIAERDELKNRLFVMRQCLAAVIAERNEMKIRTRLYMAAALISNVVVIITTFAF